MKLGHWVLTCCTLIFVAACASSPSSSMGGDDSGTETRCAPYARFACGLVRACGGTYYSADRSMTRVVVPDADCESYFTAECEADATCAEPGCSAGLAVDGCMANDPQLCTTDGWLMSTYCCAYDTCM